MEKIETCGVMKFLHLKGYSAQQIYDGMKAVYGDLGPSYSTATYRKRNFQTGHMSLTNEPRSGPSVRPSPSSATANFLTPGVYPPKASVS